MKHVKARFEIKYLIPTPLKSAIMHDVLKMTDVDGNVWAKNGSYLVKSLYFDSYHRTAYQEKMSGILARQKLRIRMYGGGGSKRFLEVKERVKNRIIKNRAILSESNYQRSLQCRPLEGVEIDDTLKKYSFCISKNNFRPTLLIEYQRQPLVGRVDRTLRITFDSNILVRKAKSLENFDASYTVLPRGYSILEVKFNDVLPHWVNHLVRKYALQDVAYSKYCLGLEELARRKGVRVG